MSHQVKLCDVVFDDLDILKKAISEEGLKITDSIHGYGRNFVKGSEYTQLRKKQTVMFGIDSGGGRSPSGIVKNEDGTYELVGDEWGVSYRKHGLRELGSRLAQRYRIGTIQKVAKAKGWTITDVPKQLIEYRDAKSKLRVELRPGKKLSVGVMS